MINFLMLLVNFKIRYLFSFINVFGINMYSLRGRTKIIYLFLSLSMWLARAYLSDILNFISIRHKRAEIRSREVNKEL